MCKSLTIFWVLIIGAAQLGCNTGVANTNQSSLTVVIPDSISEVTFNYLPSFHQASKLHFDRVNKTVLFSVFKQSWPIGEIADSISFNFNDFKIDANSDPIWDYHFLSELKADSSEGIWTDGMTSFVTFQNNELLDTVDLGNVSISHSRQIVFGQLEKLEKLLADQKLKEYIKKLEEY